MNPQPAETLRLNVGEAHVIALREATGRPVQSRFSGDQMMYTLADGRKLYVDPYVGDRITAARIGPGQPFEIEKIERQDGNRRVVEVVVRRPKTAGTGASDRPAPAQMDSQNDRKYQPQSTPSARPELAPVPAAPPPAAVNGQGETAAAIMARCYTQAIEVALSAQACARERGLMIAPVFDDIRAMGTALFIHESGRR